jgi:hypothetical protein
LAALKEHCQHHSHAQTRIYNQDGTHVIQIDVDAPKMGQHKVAYSIGPLDRKSVAVKSFEEPGVSIRGSERVEKRFSCREYILQSDELPGAFISP